MLYPHMETNSEREKMMNRRVEILVLDFWQNKYQ
jgi:flagellar motor protein MotB